VGFRIFRWRRGEKQPAVENYRGFERLFGAILRRISWLKNAQFELSEFVPLGTWAWMMTDGRLFHVEHRVQGVRGCAGANTPASTASVRPHSIRKHVPNRNLNRNLNWNPGRIAGSIPPSKPFDAGILVMSASRLPGAAKCIAAWTVKLTGSTARWVAHSNSARCSTWNIEPGTSGPEHRIGTVERCARTNTRLHGQTLSHLRRRKNARSRIQDRSNSERPTPSMASSFAMLALSSSPNLKENRMRGSLDRQTGRIRGALRDQIKTRLDVPRGTSSLDRWTLCKS
jgi:hypothetical protein